MMMLTPSVDQEKFAKPCKIHPSIMPKLTIGVKLKYCKIHLLAITYLSSIMFELHGSDGSHSLLDFAFSLSRIHQVEQDTDIATRFSFVRIGVSYALHLRVAVVVCSWRSILDRCVLMFDHDHPCFCFVVEQLEIGRHCAVKATRTIQLTNDGGLIITSPAGWLLSEVWYSLEERFLSYIS